MIIKTLVENTAVSTEYLKRNGLSFYIETKQHKILFDLGPDESFLLNAKKLQVDISDIDTVIISHGHSDHGGALRTFLAHEQPRGVLCPQADSSMPLLSVDKMFPSGRIFLL